jgi:hypothetical protein
MPPIAAVMANFLSDELTIAMPPSRPMVVPEFEFCAIAVMAESAMHSIAVLKMNPNFLPFPMFVLPLSVMSGFMQAGVEK